VYMKAVCFGLCGIQFEGGTNGYQIQIHFGFKCGRCVSPAAGTRGICPMIPYLMAYGHRVTCNDASRRLRPPKSEISTAASLQALKEFACKQDNKFNSMGCTYYLQWRPRRIRATDTGVRVPSKRQSKRIPGSSAAKKHRPD
jgi:hypothetical protein